jgi:hypothetical protein
MRSMLPLQTVLALLMILMAVGCSQKSPPRGVTTENALKTGGAEIHQPKPNPDPIVKPAPTAVPLVDGDTRASLEADGVWNLTIDGEGAQRLFEATGVAEVDGKKTAEQYECKHLEKSYTCKIVIDAPTGTVKPLATVSQLKIAEPTFKPTEAYKSKWGYVEMDQYLTKDKTTGKEITNPFARVILEADRAEKIFSLMTHATLQEEMPADEANGYDVGTQRYGVNVLCSERPLKKDPKTKFHWCKLFLNTSTGSIALIQLPAPKAHP